MMPWMDAEDLGPAELDRQLGLARRDLARCLKRLKAVAESINQKTGTEAVWRRNALYAARGRMLSEFRTLQILRDWIAREQQKEEQLDLPSLPQRTNINQLDGDRNK